MWWNLGIGFLLLFFIIFLTWPFTIRFNLRTDAFGKKWLVSTKTPIHTLKAKIRGGEIEVKEQPSKTERIVLAYFKDLYIKLLKTLNIKEHDLSVKDDFWDNVVLKSLQFQKITVEMGSKEPLGGEAAFIFGIFLAAAYPFFGYIRSNNKFFIPEISFKNDLAGFAVTCIITLRLGQVINEAGKRYWALWKENRYAG